MHLTQVQKKGREHKDKLFEGVRAAVPEYKHCFVFSIENSRNTHLKTVRQELTDCKYVLLPPPLSLSAEKPFATNKGNVSLQYGSREERGACANGHRAESSSARRSSCPRPSASPPPKPKRTASTP